MTAVQSLERTGIVSFRGAPMTLIGPELKVTDRAPDFSLTPADDPGATLTLSDITQDGSRASLLIIVPSIDTSVCALETVRFNREVASLPVDKIGVFTISLDLPFAQKRWTQSENVNSLRLLSDYKTHRFGPDYGVLIKEIALLARSVFLVDRDGIIRYVEIVPEVAQEPNYVEALTASKALIA